MKFVKYYKYFTFYDTITLVIYMRIGIDIDDTMTDIREDLIKAAIKYDKFLGGTGLYKGSSYYPSRVFNWNENQRHYYMSTIRRNVVNNAKIKKGLLEILNKLIKDNEIIIITARSDYYYKDPLKMTQDWLKKENIPYNKLVVNSRNKGIICEENKIDIFLDDNPIHCEEAYSVGCKTYIMNNLDDNICDNKNIIRVNDFYEFYEKIKDDLK